MPEVQPPVREGDIETLRRKSALEGRPVKSNMVYDGKSRAYYEVRGNGKCEIKEVIKDE